MDAPRYNSPSRKSRFRAQGSSSPRPNAPAGEPALEPGEEAEVDALKDGRDDILPAEGSPANEQTFDPAESGGNETDDQLPAGLRLTRSTDGSYDPTRPPLVWPLVLTALLCLGVGGVGGYLLHTKKVVLGTADTPGAKATGPTLPLEPPVLAEIDSAFEATKLGKFTDARMGFTQLAEKHPEWPSMRIEAARAGLYEHNFEGSEKILATLLRVGPNVDAEFLTGLLQMTLQVYDKSEAAFGRAVALDPARPDIFYFWGECLRRQGRPQDAAEKFREALIRNQYETTEGLFQLKLWLSEIQADQETVKGSNAKIDEQLATDHPSGAALFADAARHLKTGQYKQAGERIAQAQKVVEPAVFRVILQDPIFLQESYRPELAPFYK